jgi:peptidoglycan/LPS O-acetylase OafA/YrhL
MVLLYHLWPNRLSGGYAGVDVFFVISGFLITSHLLLSPPRNVVDLLRFWGRRIRRLLPAACLVLAATLLASRVMAPNTEWGRTATYVRAAALYFVNWKLASDSVDYLAREDSATPVEHFWSLSVEEQFYLVWPILILILIGIALAIVRRRHTVVTCGLAIVVAASLGYSIYASAEEPAAAYFVTPTRMWELGMGGLLAALVVRGALGRSRDTGAVPIPRAARVILCWTGLAMITYTAFVYTGATPFPSWQALVPVLGAVAVIGAYVERGTGSPALAMSWRPVQWVGDASYSIYLWHWPLIALVPFVSGGHLGLLDKIVIIAVSLILAGLTKRFVEDRFRVPEWGRPLWKPYLLGASIMVLVVGASLLQTVEVQHLEAQAATQTQAAVAGSGGCFGAAALAPLSRKCPPVTNGALTPSPLQAKDDKSEAYAEVSGKPSCWSGAPDFKLIRCEFGDPKGTVSVALIGNSHAGSFLPALQSIADARHWRITTYMASECAMTVSPQDWGFTKSEARNCIGWVHSVTDAVVKGNFDLVVMVDRTPVEKIRGDLTKRLASYTDGFRRVLQDFSDHHVPMVILRDTPFVGKPVPDCLASHPNDYTACNAPRADRIVPDPSVQAVLDIGDPRIVVLDLTDYICDSTTCYGSVGGVPVYFDGSHLTATYSRTLAPYIEPTLMTMLRHGSS